MDELNRTVDEIDPTIYGFEEKLGERRAAGRSRVDAGDEKVVLYRDRGEVAGRLGDADAVRNIQIAEAVFHGHVGAAQRVIQRRITQRDQTADPEVQLGVVLGRDHAADVLRDHALVVVGIRGRVLADLLEVGAAAGAARLGTCIGQHRHRHRGQNGEDRDDDQKFHEGESFFHA